MLKACIFDLDGTLAYTLDSMASAANEILKSLGLPELPVDNYRYYCGDGASMLVRRCLIDAGDKELVHFEEMEKTYRERFNADPLFKVRIYPGIPELLGNLKKRGVLLGVCSNKPHEATKKVIHSLFGDRIFDGIIGQQEGIRRKPAPDAPLFLAQQFGVQPEECLYIGDTGTDMKTGNGACMHTAGAVWGFRGRTELMENKAEFLAENPGEILQIFERKIRMVLSDLDGTLLRNGAQTLPENVFPLIRKLTDLGIIFVAASGRQYANMRRMFAPVADEIAYICENGALAMYKGQCLYKEAFPKDLCRDIYDTVMSMENAEFLYSGPDHHFLIPRSREFVNIIANVVKNDYICVSKLEDIPEECVKCAIFLPEGATDEALAAWQERFGSRCDVATSGNVWIDFIPFGINKGLGVKRYCDKFGISRAMTMAFGDELNDIDLIKNAGFGIAMKHARPAVRGAASYEAETVEKVLEKLIDSEGILTEEVMECIRKKQ